MEHAESLTAREVVLALLDGAPENTLSGRMVVQKLSYFAGVTINEDFGHGLNYFGPFSRDVEDGVEIAILAGQVKEHIIRLADRGRDVREHCYTLTDEGREVVASLRSQHRQKFDAVQQVISAALSALVELNQQSLAQAAKVHLILAKQGRPVQMKDLSSVALELGWKLTEEDIRNTRELLGKLELAEDRG